MYTPTNLLTRVASVCVYKQVGMANSGPNTNASQFYITTRGENLTYLDGKHTIFGEVAEGMDVLDRINELYVDKDMRPFQDVRIKHTYVLDDPFPDPELLVVPPESPRRERPEEETVEVRLAADESLEDENEGRTEEEIEKSVREKEAKSRAVVLEMIGDLPDADVKPPEEVLFVCKLNPVTESSDLDMAFCRFGSCKSEVIRDFKTGDSLCFAFIEFTDAKHCEEAYFKMNNVLLDDRRIKVDFSQSVSKMWNKFARRGPWEKGDSDGGKNKDSKYGGGGGNKSSKLFGNQRGGRREAGGNLYLKPQKRMAGDEFELVDEDEGKSRRGCEAGRRDRVDEARRHHEKRRSPPSTKPRQHYRDDDRHGSRSSKRDKSASRDREGDRKSRRRERSPSAERGISAAKSRDKRERSSPSRHEDRERRDRDSDRRRSRDKRDDREPTSRRRDDSKRSRSRSSHRRERDSGSSKRR